MCSNIIHLVPSCNLQMTQLHTGNSQISSIMQKFPVFGPTMAYHSNIDGGDIHLSHKCGGCCALYNVCACLLYFNRLIILRN